MNSIKRPAAEIVKTAKRVSLVSRHWRRVRAIVGNGAGLRASDPGNFISAGEGESVGSLKAHGISQRCGVRSEALPAAEPR